VNLDVHPDLESLRWLAAAPHGSMRSAEITAVRCKAGTRRRRERSAATGGAWSRVRAWEVGRSPWIVGRRGATLQCRGRPSIQPSPGLQGHAVLADTHGRNPSGVTHDQDFESYPTIGPHLSQFFLCEFFRHFVDAYSSEARQVAYRLLAGVYGQGRGRRASVATRRF